MNTEVNKTIEECPAKDCPRLKVRYDSEANILYILIKEGAVKDRGKPNVKLFLQGLTLL